MTVTREGRIRLGLTEGEALVCGRCEFLVRGQGTGKDAPPEDSYVYITDDGVDTQDFIVLCTGCITELAGPAET